MTEAFINSSCVVLGGGQHAKVVIDAMIAAGLGRPIGILDPKKSLHGTRVLDCPVLGGDDLLWDMVAEGVRTFVVGLGSTSDTSARRRTFETGLAACLRPLNVQHPSAIVSSFAMIGGGTQILAGAIVGVAAELGDNVLVNSGAIVEHDCIIGDHTHIATGATLAGAVRVGAGSHLGAGCVVRQGITIGERAVIGAGAVVIRDVADGETVVGVPAKPMHKSIEV